MEGLCPLEGHSTHIKVHVDDLSWQRAQFWLWILCSLHEVAPNYVVYMKIPEVVSFLMHIFMCNTAMLHGGLQTVKTKSLGQCFHLTSSVCYCVLPCVLPLVCADVCFLCLSLCVNTHGLSFYTFPLFWCVLEPLALEDLRHEAIKHFQHIWI